MKSQKAVYSPSLTNTIITTKNADKTDWHLTTDSGKKINRSELPDKINNGAIILQTSLDGNKWINSSIHTDISSDIVFEQNSGINEIQLANGCFYRIIVAYMVEKSEEGHFDFTDVFNTALPFSEYKRYAEVYTFFAKYNENDNIVSGKKFYYNTLENTKSTTENNYVGSKSITSDNPHYGWELGSFCISGYTDTGDTNDIYLKNVGNKIRLSYKLEQDINRLNGNSDLIIANNINGSDGIFQINPHNMEHGELLIKHTNEEGIPHITEYSNYLEALTSPNADTTIQLFEEGDYEIHLDYAITDQSGIRDKTTYYRTSFSFKIRNSNCMIFLFDSKTGKELSNGDVTENGFRIDAANSKYLKAHIKKEYLNDSKTGLKEDTRSNSVAADGEIFTEEGIYTITANNQYDKYCDSTVKTIYIGQNHILAAYTKYLNTPKPYTIEELNTMIDKGYTINANGEIIEPVTTTTTTTTTTTSTTETTMVTTSELPKQETTNTSASTTLQNQTDDKKSTLPYIGGGIAGFAAISGLVLLYFKNKKKIR